MIRKNFSRFFLVAFLALSLLPIYWMLNMSLKTNEEIVGVMTLWPTHLTFDNYRTIFTDEAWYGGYINSIIYVAMNMVMSVLLALPAAYAFSRYSFLGDKHLFFWLLTNRMTPPAVFLLPYFQLYSTFGMMDTHIAVALAHLLYNVPLAVWILEGFMSGIPKEIDEMAMLEGCNPFEAFVRTILPLAKPGLTVAGMFAIIFGWNDLFFALVLTFTNVQTLPVAVVALNGTVTPFWTLCASAIFSILPLVGLAFVVERFLSKGGFAGAVR